MKISKQLFVLIWFLSESVSAQDFIGLNTSNYSGLYNISNQPASIVGTPYTWHFNLVAGEGSAQNSQLFSNLFLLKYAWEGVFDGSLKEKLNNNQKDYFVQGKLRLPSLLVSIGARGAMAIGANLRSLYFLSSSDEDLITLIREDYQTEDLHGKTFQNDFLSTELNTWMEYNFSYAHVVYNTHKHKVKAGATLKYINGLASGYLSSDINGSVKNADTVSSLSGTSRFGFSDRIDDVIQGQTPFLDFDNSAFGLDLGAEYVYSTNRLLDPYKLKVGISLLDLGRIGYQTSTESFDFTMDVNGFPTKALIGLETVVQFSDTARRYFDESPNSENYKAHLPTKLAFQADYYLGQSFYLNVSSFFFVTNTGVNGIQTAYPNNYVLTARYDERRFGVYLPIEYNSLTKINFGLSLRWGPLFLGARNLIASSSNKDENQFDLYAGLQLYKLKGSGFAR